MATKILLNSSNLSSSSGNWLRAEFVNNAAFSTNYDSLNTERTMAVTFANSGNQQGIVISLYKYSHSITGTLTVKLQEYSGGSWQTRTTDTFNINSTTVPDLGDIIYFPLSSYAVTTAPGTWRYALQATSSSIGLRRSGTAGDYFFFAFLDVDNNAPSSGDSILIANDVTLTIDQSATFGGNDAIIFCHNATLAWENPPTASYTLTLNGAIKFGTSGNIQIGTQASPIPSNKRAIIDISGSTQDNFFRGFAFYHSINYEGKHQIEFWGEESNYLRTKIASNANAGQAQIVTEDDMSSVWQVGDEICVYGKNVTSTNTVTYTISNISGKTITLNTNLDYAVFAGGAVVNSSIADRVLGIKIIGRSSGSYWNTSETYWGYFKIVGVYLSGINLYQCRVVNYNSGCLIRSIIVKNASSASGNYLFFIYYLTISPPYGAFLSSTIENIHYFLNSTPTNGVGTYISGSNLTISKITTRNCYGDAAGYNFYVTGNNNTISDVIATEGATQWSSVRAVEFTGAGMTVSNCFFSGGGQYACVYINGLYQSTFTNITIGRNGGSALYFSNSLGCKFINCSIGKIASSANYDVNVVSNYFMTVNFYDCGIGSKGIYNIENAVAGSYLRFHNYDQTTNDHRCWEVNGRLVSTGSGLSDTTVHTSGTGKFAIRFEPTNSTNNLDWSFTVPTGNIQNKTMTVAVWCKVNSSNYWGGTTYQMPRLTIDYDDGTTAYAEASKTTNWQQLFVIFTPTSTYGQITVTLSGRTDATGSNAYFYWDDMNLMYPANYALDLGGMDNWANALPVVPPVTIMNPSKHYNYSNHIKLET